MHVQSIEYHLNCQYYSNCENAYQLFILEYLPRPTYAHKLTGCAIKNTNKVSRVFWLYTSLHASMHVSVTIIIQSHSNLTVYAGSLG